jgi:hypothetical protein
MKRLLFGSLATFLTATAALAQIDSPTPTELSGAAAAGIFGGMCLIWLVVGVLPWLIAAIWVTKDANRRQSPNATLVKVLTWIPFTWLIGLIVHLVTRPKTYPGGPAA